LGGGIFGGFCDIVDGVCGFVGVVVCGDVVVVVVVAAVAHNGSVFADEDGRVACWEGFRHEENEDQAACCNEAELEEERAPDGDFGETVCDEGAEEFGGEDGGDDPLEARCPSVHTQKCQHEHP
jgi:hypothetical protein